MNTELQEAINKWNNPNIQFASSCSCYFGHIRGNKPNFTSKQSDDGSIEIHIDNEPFSIDKFEYEDFNDKTENEITEFINYVNDEMRTFQENVDGFTESINKTIIDQIMCDWENTPSYGKFYDQINKLKNKHK